MTITPEQIKKLREKTGAGMMDCKNALSEVSGDMEKAIEFLRKKGLATAVSKSSRTTSQGMICSYIHAGGKIGVLVEVNCETDFVARTGEFQTFVKDIAMHIAAANPLYIRPEDVTPSIMDSEKEVYKAQAKELNKPAAVIEKIVEGKMQTYFKENCLVEQGFVKNPDQPIKALTTELIAKLGENISIRRFTRYQLGET